MSEKTLTDAILGMVDSLQAEGDVAIEGRIMVCPGKRPGVTGARCYPRAYLSFLLPKGKTPDDMSKILKKGMQRASRRLRSYEKFPNKLQKKEGEELPEIKIEGLGENLYDSEEKDIKMGKYIVPKEVKDFVELTPYRGVKKVIAKKGKNVGKEIDVSYSHPMAMLATVRRGEKRDIPIFAVRKRAYATKPGLPIIKATFKAAAKRCGELWSNEEISEQVHECVGGAMRHVFDNLKAANKDIRKAETTEIAELLKDYFETIKKEKKKEEVEAQEVKEKKKAKKAKKAKK